VELRQLRTFVHVAELGSFSAAAERLHIAQPALSRLIQVLEQELGVHLFRRHGRGAVLTEQGRLLLARATLAITASRRWRRATSTSFPATIRWCWRSTRPPAQASTAYRRASISTPSRASVSPRQRRLEIGQARVRPHIL
jgi:hypothetical protein